MEHKMHKAERQLSDADTMAILKKGDHGTLSVQGDDGYPYATPSTTSSWTISCTSTPRPMGTRSSA